MRDKLTAITLAAAGTAVLLASAAATASDIYKYTDEDGTVHYVDRPTGAATEERVGIVSRPTDNNAVQARLQSTADTRRTPGDILDERDGERESARAEREEKADRQKKCTQARSRLESYLRAQRLYREDANGEREYLDDTQRVEAQQKAEEAVSEYCGQG